ncbi:MAG TPA: PH domain-containing protein [Steroidobacteraceae bacterium]|nr:PH domain-containing protein [Steroidobacteraceae bacterium]
MSSYVKGSLGPGEKVRYEATVSLWKFWANFLCGGLLLLAALYGFILSFTRLKGESMGSALGTVAGIAALAALVILLWPFLARKSTELVITDQRVIVKFGLVSTHSIEVRFEKIESVRVTQGLIGRMLNFGDITITGTGSTFDPIPDITRPLAFRSALNEAMGPARLTLAK